MLYHDAERLLKWSPAQHEQFVPLHPIDLIEYLVQRHMPTDENAEQFRQFGSLILAMQHHLYRLQHSRLLYIYAPLDPDLDRMLARRPTNLQRDSLDQELLERSRQLLSRANYRLLTLKEIQEILESTSMWGMRMRVQFELQHWMEVYVRGSAIGTRQRRNWRKFFRKEDESVPLYSRFVVLFRPKDDHPQRFDERYVYMRMFKNVPHSRIDVMLPGTGIQMSWYDHTRVVLPSVYSAGMALWRFVRNVFILAFFGVFKTIGIAILVVLAIGYALKNLFTFRSNVHRRHMLSVTQRLYYQSLDNNAGVLLKLLEEAEQQESLEAILVYFALLQSQGAPLADEDINRRCTELVGEATGVALEFDATHALQELAGLGIAHCENEGWKALPLIEATKQLDKTWDDWIPPNSSTK